jgi:hypothetical protein
MAHAAPTSRTDGGCSRALLHLKTKLLVWGVHLITDSRTHAFTMSEEDHPIRDPDGLGLRRHNLLPLLQQFFLSLHPFAEETFIYSDACRILEWNWTGVQNIP